MEWLNSIKFSKAKNAQQNITCDSQAKHKQHAIKNTKHVYKLETMFHVWNRKAINKLPAIKAIGVGAHSKVKNCDNDWHAYVHW